MKAIADGEIKEGTYIKVHDLSVVDRVVTTILYTNQKLNWETGTFDTSYLSNNYYYFELIEEQQDIDIQAIEDINIRPYKGFTDICNYIEGKGNEIIQAIKQLDRNIKG